MNTDFGSSTQQQLENFQRRLASLEEFYTEALTTLGDAHGGGEPSCPSGHWPGRIAHLFRRFRPQETAGFSNGDWEFADDTAADIIDPPYTIVH